MLATWLRSLVRVLIGSPVAAVFALGMVAVAGSDDWAEAAAGRHVLQWLRQFDAEEYRGD